jgi:hypothetical protein
MVNTDENGINQAGKAGCNWLKYISPIAFISQIRAN